MGAINLNPVCDFQPVSPSAAYTEYCALQAQLDAFPSVFTTEGQWQKYRDLKAAQLAAARQMVRADFEPSCSSSNFASQIELKCQAETSAALIPMPKFQRHAPDWLSHIGGVILIAAILGAVIGYFRRPKVPGEKGGPETWREPY